MGVAMLEDGERATCLFDDWYNAFGDKSEALHAGVKVTVIGSRYIGGTRFLEFKEHPGNYYMEATAFVRDRKALH